MSSIFNIGPNNFWLDMHGLLMFLIMTFGAFVFGAVYFGKDPDANMVRRLKISSVVTFVALLLLMITGIVPDAGFGSGATFSYVTHNAFGSFTSHVTDTTLGNFTGPLLFDMMEHTSQIVPGLSLVILFLIYIYGDRVITVPTIRRSVESLMVLAGAWTLVIGAIGVYITKALTYPIWR